TRDELDGDQNRPALELHLVALDTRGVVVEVGARGHVVLPAVPGAGHDGALELTFTERPAAVQAGVVDGVEGARPVEKGDLLATDRDALAGSGRHVAHLRDLHEVRHAGASGTRGPTRQPAGRYSAAATGGAAVRRSSHCCTTGASVRIRPSA